MDETTDAANTTKAAKTYALVSHESAVEAIWALAAQNWEGVLDDEDIWLVPAPENCVRTQREFARLRADVDLERLGILGDPVHMLVPNKSCYSRGKHAAFHVWTEFFPPHSFVRIHDRVFVSTPYFAALQLAMARRPSRLSRKEAQDSAEQDARMRAELGFAGEASSAAELVRWGNIARMARAVQVLCDFMGTYRYVPVQKQDAHDTGGCVFDTKPIIAPKKLHSYLDQMGSVRGIRRARTAESLAFAHAASPMETLLALMLSFPQNMGGFGLPRPELNREIPVAPHQRGIVGQNKIVADLCWYDRKVAVEYYGWDEHFGAGPAKVASDCARANSLAAMGWTVLHATFEQVKTYEGISLLACQVAWALGSALPPASDLELVWRSRLLALLLPRISER